MYGDILCVTVMSFYRIQIDIHKLVKAVYSLDQDANKFDNRWKKPSVTTFSARKSSQRRCATISCNFEVLVNHCISPRVTTSGSDLLL